MRTPQAPQNGSMYLWTSPSSSQTWGAAFVFLPKYGNGITVDTVVEFSLGMSKPPQDFSFGGWLIFSLELLAVVFVHFRLTALAYHIKRQ